MIPGELTPIPPYMIIILVAFHKLENSYSRLVQFFVGKDAKVDVE